MKFLGLDNRLYSVSLGEYAFDEHKQGKSSLHERAANLLRSLYPLDPLFEELVLPGTGGLRLDLFLSRRMVGVECQGIQHYEFNNYFFKDKLDFGRAQLRDRRKNEWCQLNRVTLIHLPYNESDEQWRNRILHRS